MINPAEDDRPDDQTIDAGQDAVVGSSSGSGCGSAQRPTAAVQVTRTKRGKSRRASAPAGPPSEKRPAPVLTEQAAADVIEPTPAINASEESEDTGGREKLADGSEVDGTSDSDSDITKSLGLERESRKNHENTVNTESYEAPTPQTTKPHTAEPQESAAEQRIEEQEEPTQKTATRASLLAAATMAGDATEGHDEDSGRRSGTAKDESTRQAGEESPGEDAAGAAADESADPEHAAAQPAAAESLVEEGPAPTPEDGSAEASRSDKPDSDIEEPGPTYSRSETIATAATPPASCQALRPRGRERRNGLAGQPAHPASSREAKDIVHEFAKDTARPRQKVGRGVLRRSRQILMLLLVAALVLATGAVITNRGDQPEIPNPAEQARGQARSSAQQLLSLANAVRQSQPTPALNPALDYSARALTAAAETLRPTGTAAALAPKTASTGASETQAAGGGTLAELLKELRSTARQNLEAAADPAVDSGMARLLAAVGTGQAVAAQYLEQLSQQDPQRIVEPLTLSLPLATSLEPTSCASSEASRSQNDHSRGAGVGTGQALAAAASAEQRAVYSYQVALPKLTSATEAGRARRALEDHRKALEDAETRTAASCAQAPARQPGFALDNEFLRQPEPALGRLEDQMSVVYGDLVGLSDGSTRSWAITRLLATAQAQLPWAPPERALPGMPAGIGAATAGASG